MKKIAVAACMVLAGVSSTLTHAQSINNDYRGLALYLEAGGAANNYSLNLERTFTQLANFKITWRAGVAAATYTDEGRDYSRYYRAVPVGIHAFNRLSNNGHMEIGFDAAYIKGTSKDIFDENKTITLSPSIGYRFQRRQGGFFLKALYTPYIVLKEFTRLPIHTYPPSQKTFWNHYFGVSLGYYFPPMVRE